jgi:hypothetical protein
VYYTLDVATYLFIIENLKISTGGAYPESHVKRKRLLKSLRKSLVSEGLFSEKGFNSAVFKRRIQAARKNLGVDGPGGQPGGQPEGVTAIVASRRGKGIENFGKNCFFRKK